MEPADDLFRTKTRKNSPQQLAYDDALQVMRPRFFWAGIGLVILCLGAIVFSFTFRIPVTVVGKGIILSGGGVIDVVATATGQVTQLRVEPGDELAVEEIVAEISQPELELEWQSARAEAEDAERSFVELRAFQTREAIVLDEALAQRIQSLDQRISTLERRKATLNERVNNFTVLFNKGNMSRENVLTAESDLAAIDAQIADARDEESEIRARRADQSIVAEAALLEAELAVSRANRKAQNIGQQFQRHSIILSPFTGRIVEIKANVGQFVQNGVPVLSLERDPDAAPIVVAYISGADGKRITTGMAAEIAPASGLRDEYGFIRGRVLRVADTPASSAGMNRRLQNDRLLETFMQQITTPFEVEIALETDAYGNLLWSRPHASPVEVENGTLANVTFTLSEMPLAALAIQALKGVTKKTPAAEK